MRHVGSVWECSSRPCVTCNGESAAGHHAPQGHAGRRWARRSPGHAARAMRLPRTMSRSASASATAAGLRRAGCGQVESGQPPVQDAGRVVHLTVAHHVDLGFPLGITARSCRAAMGAAVSWARCKGDAITAHDVAVGQRQRPAAGHLPPARGRRSVCDRCAGCLSVFTVRATRCRDPRIVWLPRRMPLRKSVVRELGTASPFQIPPRLAKLPSVPSPGSARGANAVTPS